MMTGKARFTSRLRHLLLVAAGSHMIACGDDPAGPDDSNLAVARVEVVPATLSLGEGHQLQIAARVFNAQGQLLPNRAISWSTSNRDIAEMIAPNGTVLARREGTATIFAECEGVRGQAQLAVLRAVVNHVIVTPTFLELAPGEQANLEAQPWDDLGHMLEGRTIEWSTGDPLVATVTSTGRVTAHAFGSVLINATVEGVTGSAALFMIRVATNVTEIDLGTLGGVLSVAQGANSQGVVVGYSTTPTGQPHAFRWTSASGMQDLGTLGGASSSALAINDNGEIVGWSVNSASFTRPFRRPANGPMQEIAISSPGGQSEATAINSAGDIAGTYVPVFTKRGFLLTAGGTLHEIGTLPGFDNSAARSLNAQRTVVGSSFIEDSYYYYGSSNGFRWSDGSFRELNVQSLDALGVNDAGEVVGTTVTAQPYRWTPGQQPIVLPTFGLTSFGAAHSINQHGQVAGYAFAATNHAVVWLPSGERIILSASNSQALAISNTGWVVGWRVGAGLALRATLWKIAGVSQP